MYGSGVKIGLDGMVLKSRSNLRGPHLIQIACAVEAAMSMALKDAVYHPGTGAPSTTKFIISASDLPSNLRGGVVCLPLLIFCQTSGLYVTKFSDEKEVSFAKIIAELTIL